MNSSIINLYYQLICKQTNWRFAAIDSIVITICTKTDTGIYYYNKTAHRQIIVRGVQDQLKKAMLLFPLNTLNYLHIRFYMRNGNVEHACLLHIHGTDISYIFKSFFNLNGLRDFPQSYATKCLPKHPETPSPMTRCRHFLWSLCMCVCCTQGKSNPT